MSDNEDGQLEEEERISANDLLESVDEEDEKDASSYDSDESSDDDKFANEAPSSYRREVETTPNFFDTFDGVPDIDKISLTESMQREIAKEQGDGERLSAEEEQITEPTNVEVEERPTEVSIGEEEEEQKEVSTEYSEFKFDFELDDEEEQQAVTHLADQKPDEDLFEALVNEQKVDVVFIVEPDFELLARQEELRLIKNATKDFLRALIDVVVNRTEERRADKELREKLDKVKMLRTITSLLKELNVEVKVNEFLDKQCVSYYRRQKCLRPIKPDILLTKADMDRYEEALADLNNKLGLEAANKEIVIKKFKTYEEKAAALELKLKREVISLELLIKKSINPSGDAHMHLFVERRLAEMSKLRKEISKIREENIHQQHEKATLTKEMERLENITDTLHLSDYELLLVQKYELSKRLEEKNDRLEKWRHLFNTNIHRVAHIQETKTLLFRTIKDQEKILLEAEAKRDQVRATLHELRLNRLILRNRILKLNNSSDLVGKPVLLVDYDQTVERVSEIRAKVKAMKHKIDSINKRIVGLEKFISIKITSNNCA